MFQFDGPFFEVLGKITDVIFLSFLWFIMSIPIVTIGASTTAAYYVAFNQLNKRDGYVVSSFFRSFKENFKQSTILFIGIVVLGGIICLNLYAISNGLVAQDSLILKNLMMGVQFFVLIELAIFSLYCFSINAKLTFTLKELAITSLILGNKHLVITLLNGVLIVGIYYAVMYIPMFIFFAGAVYIMVSAFLLKIVIKKYRNDVFDSDLDEDELRKLYK